MLPKYKTMEIFHMDLILSEWKMPSWMKDKITTTFCHKKLPNWIEISIVRNSSYSASRVSFKGIVWTEMGWNYFKMTCKSVITITQAQLSLLH